MKQFYLESETKCLPTFVSGTRGLRNHFLPGLALGLLKNTLFLFTFLLSFLNMTAQNPGISLEQGQNGKFDAPISPVAWIRGNVNAQKAHLLENYAVPYRIVMDGLDNYVGQSVTVEFGYETQHGGRMAIDFLTYYDHMFPHDMWPGHTTAELIQPWNGYTVADGYTPAAAVNPAVFSQFLIPQPSSVGSPVPGQPGDEWQRHYNHSAGQHLMMTAFNAVITDIHYTLEQTLQPLTSTANRESHISVTFTVNAPTVILAFGGHIASVAYWGRDANGTPYSAAGINGSPYHVWIVNWSVKNPGNQDVQLAAAAVFEEPICDFSPVTQSPVCTNTSMTFNVDNPNPDLVYAWSLINQVGTNATPVTGSGNTYTINSGTQPGSFTVQLVSSFTFSGVTVSNTCTYNVVVNAFTANAGADQTICAGSTVTLAGSIGGGASTGTWSGGTGIFTPGATTLNAVYTPGAADITAGTVTLTLTTDAGACSAATDQMVIHINPPATANAGADQSICAGSTVSLNGSVGGGASSGTWSGGAGAFSPNANTLNAVYTPTAGEVSAGTVTLTLTSNDPDGPCGAASDQMVITINPPATANAGVDQTICAGSTVSLNGSVGGGASSGTWSGGAGAFSPNASTLNAVYTPGAADITAGTVTLTLTSNNPDGPCEAVSDQMVITINPPATANAGVDQTICAGSTVTLNGSIGGGAASGTWSGGLGSFNPNASTLNAVYTPTAGEVTAGTVTLTLTSNNPDGPCEAVSDQMVIRINPQATANAGVDQTICAGSTVSLNGSVGGGASSGTWSGGAGAFSPNASTLNAVYTPSAGEVTAGTVTLTLTSNNPDGPCEAVSDQMVIRINPQATANAGADQTICAGSTVSLNGSVGGGASTGTWSGGAGAFSPNAGTLNAVYTPTAGEVSAGTVTLTLTSNDPDGPCGAASDQMVITINPPATANAGADQTLCAGTPVQLAGSVGGGASSGTWSGGDGSFSPNANTLNAVYTPGAADIAAGSVTLTLTSNDPAGPCAAASDQMVITFKPCNGFCFYTQGFYGNEGGTKCSANGPVTAYDIMYGIMNAQPGKLYVFGKGTKTFTLYLADIVNKSIFLMLPGTSTSAALKGAATYSNTSTWGYVPISAKPKSYGTINNVLLSQTMTFFFNLGWNPDAGSLAITGDRLVTVKSADCGKTADLTARKDTFAIPGDVITFMAANGYGNTLQGLLNLANDVLGGLQGISPASVTAALDAFNVGFDGCAILVEFYNNLKVAHVYTGLSQQDKSLDLLVYPNPFGTNSNLKFEFKSPSDTHVILELFDIRGAKVKTLYNGSIKGGQLYKVEYNGSDLLTGTYLYRLIDDVGVKTGELIKR